MSVSRTVVLTTVKANKKKTDVKRCLRSNDQRPRILYSIQNQGRVLDSGQERSKSVLWNSMALRGTREERGRGKEEEDVSNLVFYVRWTSTVISGRRRRRRKNYNNNKAAAAAAAMTRTTSKQSNLLTVVKRSPCCLQNLPYVLQSLKTERWM